MVKFTDGDLLSAMTEGIMAKCVANDGDDYKEKVYYYNGQYTDYGMDVTKLKPLKFAE